MTRNGRGFLDNRVFQVLIPKYFQPGNQWRSQDGPEGTNKEPWKGYIQELNDLY